MKNFKHILRQLITKGLTVATAESCTAGRLADKLTSQTGAGGYFRTGFVTYADESKHELLGVSKSLLKKYGAVSKEVAVSMALGAKARAKADIALSVTGIAGPNGGTRKTPLGLVYIGYADAKGSNAIICRFKGTRSEIKEQAAREAIKILGQLTQNYA